MTDNQVIPSSIPERCNYLKQIPQFSILDQDGREQLSLLLQKQSCPPGHMFFPQGADTDAMYFIVEGMVDVIRDGDSVAHIGANNFFGEVGILNQQPRNASVKSITDTVYYVLPGFLVKNLVDQEPVIAMFFEKILSDRG